MTRQIGIGGCVVHINKSVSEELIEERWQSAQVCKAVGWIRLFGRPVMEASFYSSQKHNSEAAYLSSSLGSEAVVELHQNCTISNQKL